MKKLILVALASVSVLAGLLSCASGARGHGPVDSFVLPAASNPSLSGDLPGALNVTVEPKEVFFVVAPGTNVHSLVAKLSLNAEATITVISSGTRVVQQNGITPNDFSVPVIYSIEVPGEKQPWRYRVVVREQETNPRLVRLVLPGRLDAPAGVQPRRPRIQIGGALRVRQRPDRGAGPEQVREERHRKRQRDTRLCRGGRH